MKHLIACAAIGALTLAACSPDREPAQPTDQAATAPAPEPAPEVGYACESGKTVTARYAADQTAQVIYEGKTYAMRTAVSASGARYVGSGMEWWTATRGDTENATLSRLGPNEDVGVAVLERCSRPAAAPTEMTGPQPANVTGSADACLGPSLRATMEGGDAGAGNRVNVVGLTNVGSKPCSLTGYPTVALLDAQGAVLNQIQQVNEPGSYFRQGQAPTAVVIQPQGKAFFDIAWSAVPHEDMGEKTCPSATRMRITAPGDTAAVSVVNAIQPCGKRLRVNPVRAEKEPAVTPPATSG